MRGFVWAPVVAKGSLVVTASEHAVLELRRLHHRHNVAGVFISALSFAHREERQYGFSSARLCIVPPHPDRTVIEQPLLRHAELEYTCIKYHDPLK
jgi:hypothetical protein